MLFATLPLCFVKTTKENSHQTSNHLSCILKDLDVSPVEGKDLKQEYSPEGNKSINQISAFLTRHASLLNLD